MKTFIIKNIYLFIIIVFGVIIYYNTLFSTFFISDEISIKLHKFHQEVNLFLLGKQFFSLLMGVLASSIILLNGYIFGYILENKFSLHFSKVSMLASGIIIYAIYIFLIGSIFHIIGTLAFKIITIAPLLSAIFLKNIRPSIKDLLSFLNQKLTDNNFIVIFIISIIPLLFSNTYPIDYDVLEYHLGAPKEFYQNGVISFLPHNVYANMPSISSMLNLVLIAFNLGDSAKILQTMFVVLTAMILYNDTKKKLLGIMAAFLFLLSPEIILGSYSARNEPMIMFLTIVSFRIIFSKERNVSALFLGILAGGLFCLKYSSLILIIPIIIFFITINESKNFFTNNLKFFSGMFIVSLPWLIRNFLASNNPLFPFLSSFFSIFFKLKFHPDLSFNSAHLSHIFTLKDFLTSINSTFQGFDALNIWIVFLPFIFIIKKPYIKKLAAIILAGTALWFFFTHRLERFLLPFLPFKIALIVAILAYFRGWKRNFLLSGYFIQLIFNIALSIYQLLNTQLLPLYLGKITKNEFISKYDESYKVVSKFLHKEMKEGKILLIAEARTYYYDKRILYNTPYMKPIFTKYYQNNKFDIEKLHADNIKYIFINKYEFQRVISKYKNNHVITYEEIINALLSIGKILCKDDRNGLFMVEVN